MAKRDRQQPHLLALGETIPGPQAKYRVEDILDSGPHAPVYEARDPATPWRRLALTEFSADQADQFEREARVRREAAGHPLTPAFEGAFSHDGRYYLVGERIGGETLASLIARHPSLPRRTILKWAVCLCDVLAFLHERGIVDCGLRSGGISLTPSGYPVLNLSGDARALVAAEGEPPPAETPAARADIAALGAVLYEMITGLPPGLGGAAPTGAEVTRELSTQANADPSLSAAIVRALAAPSGSSPATAADLREALRAAASPVLLGDTRRLDFGPLSQATPQTLHLRNAGGGELTIHVQSPATWLTFAPPVRRGDDWEVVVRPDPEHVREPGGGQHAMLDIRATGADSTSDRWQVDCSVQPPPAAAPEPPRSRGASFLPSAEPPHPAPTAPPHPARTAPQGETDIVPRSTVIGLIAAIVIVAGAIIAFVATHRPAAPESVSSGPSASAPSAAAPAHHAPSSNTAATSTTAGNLLRSTGDAAAWSLETTHGGAASMTVEGGALHVKVSRAAQKYWHVQFYQTPSGLRPNRTYTLSFRAKAATPCDLPTGGSVNYGDYHPIGLTTHFQIGRDWQTYSHAFTTQSFTGAVRLPVFMVGTKPNQYWLSDVTLTPTGH